MDAPISSSEAIENWLELTNQFETVTTLNVFQDAQPLGVSHDIPNEYGGVTAERPRLRSPFLRIQERHQDQVQCPVKNVLGKRSRSDNSIKSPLKSASFCKDGGERGCDKQLCSPHKPPNCYISSDSDAQHNEESSSFSSSSDSSVGTPPVSYQRRPRRKTRINKYDLKKDVKGKYKCRKGTTRVEKRHKKHKRREKSSAALLHGFSARNVNTERLTLKPSSSIGLFRKGRASSPRKRSGLPDLAFSEIKFLDPRRNGSSSDREAIKASKSFRPPRKKAVDKDEEMSHFFTGDQEKHKVRCTHKQIDLPHGSESQLQGKTKDISSSRHDKVDKISSLSVTDVPETPSFLGFGKPGNLKHDSIHTEAVMDKSSPDQESEQVQNMPLRTSQISWSESPLSKRRARRDCAETTIEGRKAHMQNSLINKDSNDKRVESTEIGEKADISNSRKRPVKDTTHSKDINLVEDLNTLLGSASQHVDKQKQADKGIEHVRSGHESQHSMTVPVRASPDQSERQSPDNHQEKTATEHISKMESELFGLLGKWSSRIWSLHQSKGQQSNREFGNEFSQQLQESGLHDVQKELNVPQSSIMSEKGQFRRVSQKRSSEDLQSLYQGSSGVSGMEQRPIKDQTSIEAIQRNMDAPVSQRQEQLSQSLNPKSKSQFDIRTAIWDGHIGLYERQFCSEYNNSLDPFLKSTKNANRKDPNKISFHTHMYGVPLSESMGHKLQTHPRFRNQARNDYVLADGLSPSTENLEDPEFVADPGCLGQALEHYSSCNGVWHEHTREPTMESDLKRLHYQYPPDSQAMHHNPHQSPQNDNLPIYAEDGIAKPVGGEGNITIDDPAGFWKPNKLY